MMNCPDCTANVESPWHTTVHEAWEAAQAARQEHVLKGLGALPTLSVEMTYEGVTYHGILYPVEEQEE